jgi:DNA-binding HxlR family transcriptional regulator
VGSAATSGRWHQREDARVDAAHLEADGLVVRTAYPEVPPRVEYALTARGDELMQRVLPLMAWIADNADEIVAR